MTVCIAATYWQDDEPRGIVLAADRQLTDLNTSRKSSGLKIGIVGPRITILGSGDMEYFGDLISRTLRKLASVEDITVGDTADAYWEAESDWLAEYQEKNVLKRFYNLTWKTYYEKLEAGQLPDAYFAEINADLKALRIPCEADVIVAGIDFDDTRRSRVTIMKLADGIKDDRTKDGFAIIGEGDTIAQAEFGSAKYHPFWSRSATLFLCYLAKRRSEEIASVGPETDLFVISPKQGRTLIKGKFKEEIESVRKRLEKSREGSENRAYEKVKEITQEHGAAWANERKSIEETSATLDDEGGL